MNIQPRHPCHSECMDAHTDKCTCHKCGGTNHGIRLRNYRELRETAQRLMKRHNKSLRLLEQAG